MVDPVAAPAPSVVALICISDTHELGGATNPVLMPVFGNLLIHHILKSLQDIGVKKFFIGVDAMPGSLLSYADKAKSDGLQVEFVRNPDMVAGLVDDATAVLTIDARTLWAPELLKDVLNDQRSLIATVDESAENQAFERIDLNTRWAGLAIVSRATLARLSELPDGWDMASAVLRQAVQDGVARRSINQAEIRNKRLLKLKSGSNLTAALPTLRPDAVERQNSLESVLFDPVTAKILPSIFATESGPLLVDWAFPVLSLSSATLAVLALPGPAIGIAFVALLSFSIRKAARAASYQSDDRDWLGGAGGLLLLASLAFILHADGGGWPEAAFLALLSLGISTLARRLALRRRFWLASPLAIAAATMVGQVSGTGGWPLRLLILAELGWLLIGLFRPRSTPLGPGK